jgi:hypothetical protein
MSGEFRLSFWIWRLNKMIRGIQNLKFKMKNGAMIANPKEILESTPNALTISEPTLNFSFLILNYTRP